ncbi:MAG: KTSC domain-containing protein [Paraclostridium sp.]
MNLLPVSSSRMSRVGWEHNTMYIEFKNGKIYVYDNVSKSEYESFINSPSLGSALHSFDKKHNYRPL